MADIDEVIERSRERGEFSERKKFTVARSRAIQKMRQFALADTSYYVLEWIQSAVANGATYLDLAISSGEVRMSYVGGGFPRDELEALFDFLFASKDDLDVADTRQLALGVNALLGADPDVIVIESGNGTLESTTRVEIDGRTDTVSVGTPLRALKGTFVRASGLTRRHGELKELRVIEERCLTATIPILVNDEPLFGYRSVRSPELFGYRRVVKFDEGDLYGTIGIATTPITRNFKLITFGTWITSDRHSYKDLPEMGGVIGYDRLRKTADHSGIVRDDVYAEMWARLLPYARQLASGREGGATFDVKLLDGTPVTAREFRELARESNRAVVFEETAMLGDIAIKLAGRYGRVFEAPVFVIAGRERETVRHLGGPEVEVLMPRLDPDELRFYELPVAEPPPRPWLTGALEVTELDPAQIAARIPMTNAQLARHMRASTGIDATVYTPAELPESAELWVEVRLMGRTVWTGSVPTAYAGHVLVVNIADVPLEVFRAASGTHDGYAIAHAVSISAQPVLEQATQRVLRAMRPDNEVPSAGRRIAIAALARSVIKRVRCDESGAPRIRFVVSDDQLPSALLDVEVFETAAGTELSLREIETMMVRTRGLMYAMNPGEELPGGVDPNYVLVFDAPTEGSAILLFGEMVYVRVHDIDFGDGTPAAAGVTLEYAVSDAGIPTPTLVPPNHLDHLRAKWSDPESGPIMRRALWRHLVWNVLFGDERARQLLRSTPLFGTPDGQLCTFAALEPGLQSDAGIAMYDGWTPQTPARLGEAPVDSVHALGMNAHLLYLMNEVGRIRPIMDVDLDNAEAAQNPRTPSAAFLASATLDEEGGGRIGFPIVPVDDPVIMVVNRQSSTALRSVAAEFGVVGRIVNESRRSLEEIETRCGVIARGLINDVIRRLASMAADTDRYVRALEVLLDYAAGRTQVFNNPDHSLSVLANDETTRRILDLPICPTTSGVSVSPWRFLREFATFGDRDTRPGRAELAEDTPPPVRAWFHRVLAPDRIVGGLQRPQLPPPTQLDRWLTSALQELRTDEDELIEVRVLSEADFAGQLTRFTVGRDDMIVTEGTVFIRHDFWLLRGVADATSDDPNPEQAAWLLLAIYARVNELRLSVTNVHEVHFQSRVLDWLDG